MSELLLIYGGLFTVVWTVFKLSRRHNNPFKNVFFWTILLLTSAGFTAFLFYSFTNNFFGAPPEDGWNRRYHKNGKIETEFFAADGKIEGVYKSYYLNGQLQFYSKYANGMQIDTSFAYYENGQTSNLQVFKDSKTIFEVNYSHNGLKKSERYNPIDTLEDNYYITYYPNGKKEFETRIDNRNLEGNGIYYYTTGRIKYQGQYKDGRKNGIWLYLDSLTGNILDRDTFNFKKKDNSKKDGDRNN